MTKLSVNINKIATLRNSRGENNPNLLSMALYIESLGVHGITIHPRPDERHIKREDVYQLKEALKIELNVEGYPSKDFLNLIKEIRPKQTTLVPDPPNALTSNAGFLLKDDFNLVKEAVNEIRAYSKMVSIFVDPKDFLGRDLNVIKATTADRIELYTAKYAKDFHAQVLSSINNYKKIAREVSNLGMSINAGHDLNQQNLGYFLKEIPFISEVSIGHALISDALVDGMAITIKRYLEIVENK